MSNQIRYKFATFFHNQLRKFKRTVLPRKFLSPGDQYFKSGGNDKLIDLEITPHALCIDFGGYKGTWATAIADKFNCYVRIYEPVLDFAKSLEINFNSNMKITICSYGISDKNKNSILSVDGAASGSYIHSDQSVMAEFRDAFELTTLGQIDVVKINIEGGEYELIPELHKKGVLQNISTIFVQFHKTGNENIEYCKKLLKRSHRCSWSYDFVWERWDKIEI